MRRPALTAAMWFACGIGVQMATPVAPTPLLWVAGGLWCAGLACIIWRRRTAWVQGIFGGLLVVLGCAWCGLRTRVLPPDHFLHVLHTEAKGVVRGRVVAEIDMTSSSLFRSSARVIVVFPAPDGEDRTYIRPRRVISSFIIFVKSLGSFLYLCYS